MMVSIHGPDDSEFDFRTAMNIWGKLRKRHILVEKAKESTEKSKLLKRIVMKSLLLRKITRERRIKRDMNPCNMVLVSLFVPQCCLHTTHTTKSPFTFNTLDKRAV
jgi:hypothetical protein